MANATPVYGNPQYGWQAPGAGFAQQQQPYEAPNTPAKNYPRYEADSVARNEADGNPRRNEADSNPRSELSAV